MWRIASFVVVALLVAGASGAGNLVTPERCSPGETSSTPDGHCPPLCARCTHCAQAVDILIVLPSTGVSVVSNEVLPDPEFLPLVNVREVFHVPKRSA